MINLSKKLIVLPRGLGIAVGAATGAALALTEQEDRLLGGVRPDSDKGKRNLVRHTTSRYVKSYSRPATE
jgi:hypothetical protein